MWWCLSLKFPLSFALTASLIFFVSLPTIDGKKCFREIRLTNHLQQINEEFGSPPIVVKDLEKGTTKIVQYGNDVATVHASSDPSAFNPTNTTAWKSPNIYLKTVQLPINHFGPSPPPHTFANRFWVVDEYYKPGGPVFTFDTGEAQDASAYLVYLSSNKSFVNSYLREFNGLGILWEHRYYGKSTPFPVNKNTTAEQMQYLCTEQALADFDYFAKRFKWTIGGGNNGTIIDFNPKRVPWVHIGGSYPGIRAALLRETYPETIFAAYASSAPVQAQADMRVYLNEVYRGMVADGMKSCTDLYQSAVNYIDHEMKASHLRAAKIKKKFLGRTADKNSNEGFADALLLPLFAWQSKGVSDPVWNGFCKVLEYGTETPDEKMIKNGGISRKRKFNELHRGRLVAERWANWKTFLDLVNAYVEGAYCEGPHPVNRTKPNCVLDGKYESVLSVSWTWQYCTEWGFFQATNNDSPHPLGSVFNTLTHQQKLCYRQFPDGLSSGFLPSSPRTHKINKRFGGWYMRPSNTFWTGGEYDPWRALSPLSDQMWSPGFEITQEIPICGVKRLIDEPLFGYLLKNAQHVFDFKSAQVVKEAAVPQRLFAKALRTWLECFPRGKGVL